MRKTNQIATVLSTLMWLTATTAADQPISKLADNEVAKPFRMLLMDPPKDSLKYEAAVEKRKATAEAYRDQNVDVRSASTGDLEAWLKKDGAAFASALPMIQRMQYAKARRVDGIGGFEIGDVTFDFESNETEPAVGQWFINLKSLECVEPMYMRGPINTDAAPIANRWGMHAYDITSAFEIATGIGTGAEIRDIAHDGKTRMNENRTPRRFIGISFEKNIIEFVESDSPADKAGLKAGDRLVSANGKPVNMESLMRLIQDSERERIAIVYERAAEQLTVDIAPVEYSQFYRTKRAKVGDERLPAFEGKDHNGKPFKFEQLRGKIVILKFWGTWCGPCIREMPQTVLAAEGFDDVELVTVCHQCDEDEWMKFIKDNQLPGRHLRTNDLSRQLYVSGFPTTYLLDREGKLTTEVSGFFISRTIATFKDIGGLKKGIEKTRRNRWGNLNPRRIPTQE